MTGWCTLHTACKKVATPDRLYRQRGVQARVVAARMELEDVAYEPVKFAHNISALQATIQTAFGGGGVSKKVARTIINMRERLSLADEVLEAALLPDALAALQEQDPQVSFASIVFVPFNVALILLLAWDSIVARSQKVHLPPSHWLTFLFPHPSQACILLVGARC